MKNSIGYSITSFCAIVFFDENENILMELYDSFSSNYYGMRVPCVGEVVSLASYEHDRTNDERALFYNNYVVKNVFSHYSENKAFKNVSVQYSVILKKL